MAMSKAGVTAPSKLISLLTGHTSSKKKIVFSASYKQKQNMWMTSEDASLIDYLIKRGYSEAWPKSRPRCVELWEGAVQYLSERGHKVKRTSKKFLHSYFQF